MAVVHIPHAHSRLLQKDALEFTSVLYTPKLKLSCAKTSATCRTEGKDIRKNIILDKQHSTR